MPGPTLIDPKEVTQAKLKGRVPTPLNTEALARKYQVDQKFDNPHSSEEQRTAAMEKATEALTLAQKLSLIHI